MGIGVTLINDYVCTDSFRLFFRYREEHDIESFLINLFWNILQYGEGETVTFILTNDNGMKELQANLAGKVETFCNMVGMPYKEVTNLENRLAVALCPLNLPQSEQIKVKKYLETNGFYLICDTSRWGLRTIDELNALEIGKSLLLKADIIYNIVVEYFNCNVQRQLLNKFIPKKIKVVDVDWEEVMGDA